MTECGVSEMTTLCHPDIGFWNPLTLSSRTCFGIFILILSEGGGPLTVNVAFSSDQRVSVLKRTAVVWARSRTGTLRDDRRGVRRGRLYGMSVLLPSRHPDNAPGQDPCPSRKRDSVFHERARRGEKERTRLKRRDPVQKHHGMTEEARKRDHRIRSVPFFARSVQHFLDRDAETSSDTLSCQV